MKMFLALIATFLSATAFTGDVFAQVQVDGYYRKDGTYVRPHVRSAPDGNKWNNYGPSNGVNMQSPYGRDADGDGVENRFDKDDDNDGTLDNLDRTQYGF